MKKLKILGLSAVLVVLGYYFWPKKADYLSVDLNSLRDVTVTDKKVTAHKTTGNVSVTKTRPEMETIITRSGNELKVYVKPWGVGFWPGVTFGPNLIGLDVQVAFYRRLSLHTGVGNYGLDKFDPLCYVAGGLLLYHNTSVEIGYSSKQKMMLGLGVKF